MKKTLIFVLLAASLFGCTAAPSASGEMRAYNQKDPYNSYNHYIEHWEDELLANCLRAALGKELGERISYEEVESIRYISIWPAPDAEVPDNRKPAWFTARIDDYEFRVPDEYVKGDVVRTLADMVYFKNLETLQIGYSWVYDLTPLAGLKNLKNLNLHGSPVAYLDPIFGMTQLESLTLSETPVKGIEFVKYFPKLMFLNVSGIFIEDLSALSACPELEFLGADSCGITDVSPLAALKKLKKLTLRNNNIMDFSPLDPGSFEFFYAEGNPGSAGLEEAQ